MSLIHIVIDSTADLTAELQTRYRITIVPINIQFGQESFRENVDLDRGSFYHKIEATNQLPKTSQPSPGAFIEAYRAIARPGDSILSMHVTSKLSGTCQSAELAAKELRGEIPVTVFDSLCGSAALGLMAVEAARMSEAGADMPAVVGRMEQIRSRVNIFLSPENLKYLQMSGRVSNVQAVIGSMLSLKPIISLDHGLLNPVARIRTRTKALDYMMNLTRERVADNKINLAVVHAESPADAEALMAHARQLFNIQESFVVDLAASLAVHFGPGCLGLISYVI